MPFVHVIMEPRDWESKHRISREISDVVAEGTNNSIDGVTVIFHEVPRNGYARGLSYAGKRPRTSGQVTGRPDYVSVNRIRIEDEAAYVALRNELVNPALANQRGFVSTLLLRLGDADHEYLLINKWMTREDHEAWLASELHLSIEDKARQSVPGRIPRERLNGEIVHQSFGPNGGAVIESSNGSVASVS